MSDGRLKTLSRADTEEIHAAQKRYAHIATTIDDAIAKLAKIVDAGSDGLRGKYVEPLKEDAEKIKDKLAKAAVRYEDVATEIGRYEPELERAKTEVAAAQRDEGEAEHAESRAKAMPDPQEGPDGTIGPEEQQKGADKQRAKDEAAAQLTAAKNRLTGALDALDVAGKRFGDAVNCNRYDDGLTDSTSDKIKAVFSIISKVFGILGMILTAFALLLPGVNLLVIAGIAAGAVALIADSVLLAYGEGTALDVAFGAFALFLGGVGLALAKFGKQIGNVTKLLGSFKFKPGVWGPGGPIPLPNWGQIITSAPRPGFFSLDWANLKGAGSVWANLFRTGNFRQFVFDFKSKLLGISGFKDLVGLFTGGAKLKPVWLIWAGSNIFFSIGAGLAFAGGRQTEVIDDVGGQDDDE
ncbi:hypothetical protein ACGFIR_21640 [Micromonospora sp. NPDC049051]|uniref:hypothetical protein n=1 Tax=unclassified Micromonospora TaxID=2617518 RepID=UPI003721C4A3